METLELGGSYEWVRKVPTISELLTHSYAVDSVIDAEQRAAELIFLNTHAEKSIGTFMWVYCKNPLLALPWGFEPYVNDTPFKWQGTLAGFEDIPTSDEEGSVLDQSLHLRLNAGIGSFRNKFTSGTFEQCMLFRVQEIDKVESLAELEYQYLGTVSEELDMNSKLEYVKLRKIIDRAYRLADKGRLTGRTIDVDLPNWGQESPRDLYRRRSLQLLVKAAFATLQQDHGGHVTKTDVKDFDFMGFFIGLIHLESKPGRSVPHFAFEMYKSPNTPTIGVHSEQVSPVLYVPISDEVEMTITPLSNETE